MLSKAGCAFFFKFVLHAWPCASLAQGSQLTLFRALTCCPQRGYTRNLICNFKFQSRIQSQAIIWCVALLRMGSWCDLTVPDPTVVDVTDRYGAIGAGREHSTTAQMFIEVMRVIVAGYRLETRQYPR
jgi:hypothetical protein